MTATAATQPIPGYFELAPQPDADAYFAQFAGDAIVEDEGTEHYGTEAIRAWRASVPVVTYAVHTIQASDGGASVQAVTLAGKGHARRGTTPWGTLRCGNVPRQSAMMSAQAARCPAIRAKRTPRIRPESDCPYLPAPRT